MSYELLLPSSPPLPAMSYELSLMSYELSPTLYIKLKIFPKSTLTTTPTDLIFQRTRNLNKANLLGGF